MFCPTREPGHTAPLARMGIPRIDMDQFGRRSKASCAPQVGWNVKPGSLDAIAPSPGAMVYCQDPGHECWDFVLHPRAQPACVVELDFGFNRRSGRLTYLKCVVS